MSEHEDQYEAHRYEREQITRALADHPDHHTLMIKIVGDENATKYLNATPAQVRAIREILGGGRPEDVVAALGGARW